MFVWQSTCRHATLSRKHVFYTRWHPCGFPKTSTSCWKWSHCFQTVEIQGEWEPTIWGWFIESIYIVISGMVYDWVYQIYRLLIVSRLLKCFNVSLDLLYAMSWCFSTLGYPPSFTIFPDWNSNPIGFPYLKITHVGMRFWGFSMAGVGRHQRLFSARRHWVPHWVCQGVDPLGSTGHWLRGRRFWISRLEVCFFCWRTLSWHKSSTS